MATARGMASPLADAARAAKTALEAQRMEKLSSFDEIAALAQKTAVALGVNVNTKYQAHLDNDALNLRVGGLALHDGDYAAPPARAWLGSEMVLSHIGRADAGTGCDHVRQSGDGLGHAP
jgi:putative ATP-dependent endonuclease of OLD family